MKLRFKITLLYRDVISEENFDVIVVLTIKPP